MDASVTAAPYDIAIIGGGINGCGIARDAAGRGWRVHLCEQADLGSGTSSASTKLVHGGLRYLEHYEFRLVREALREREILWGIAPHIIWPMRFVLPYHRNLRPRWMLWMGLLLYDNLGGRKKLPPTRGVRLERDRTGTALKPEFKHAFEYSDCWVEISARTLINAAGPWVGEVAQHVVHDNRRAPVRLVQGSHIVVPKLYEHPESYIFQNADKRIFFVIPYEQDFTLIGTTDRDYQGNPGQVHATADEIGYLCASASDYLRVPVTPDMVVWTYSGVRPLFDESGEGAAQSATRDYVLKLDGGDGVPPLLSVFGGKITTYRRLAEQALSKLAPHLRRVTGQQGGWTGRTPLPGGDFPKDRFGDQLAALRSRYPFLPDKLAHRLLRAYGTLAGDILGGAADMEDLGPIYGADFSEAELRYLVGSEWVRTAADAIWRRTKLGLRLSKPEIEAIDAALSTLTEPPARSRSLERTD